MPLDCQHSNRIAEVFCGSYFVKCATCGQTVITIPWSAAETLMRGHLAVFRVENSSREKLTEGPAEEVCVQIRELRDPNRRLELAGQQTVVTEAQLGDIKNNSLELQRAYFSRVVAEDPRDETARFALAQVLHEMRDDANANACYDTGIKLANITWLRKLPVFLLPSVFIATVGMRQHSIVLWLAAVVGIIGLALWFIINRNRQHWLPIVACEQRDATAARVEMAIALGYRVPQFESRV